MSLAEHNGRLYMAYSSSLGGAHKIDLMYTEDGLIWTHPSNCGPFSADAPESDLAPSIVSFSGRLDLAYTGRDHHLYLLETDGEGCAGANVLTSFALINSVTSNHGPSLTTFGNKLFMGWTDASTRFPTIYDFFGGSSPSQLASTSDDAPSLLGTPDNVLVAFRPSGSQSIAYARYNVAGGTFGNPVTLNVFQTSTYPTLADFGSSVTLLWTDLTGGVNFWENGVREQYVKPVLLCSAWSPRYVDSGFGEAVAGQPWNQGPQTVPASFATFSLTIGGAPLGDLAADANGCIDVTGFYYAVVANGTGTGDPRNDRDTWALRLNSRFADLGRSITWNVAAVPDQFKTVDPSTGKPNTPPPSANAVAALAAFVQAKKDHPIFRDQDAAYDTPASACQDVGVDGRFVAAPPPPTSLVDQDIINVAAVTSQVLRAPDLDIRDGTYWSFAGDTCPELFDCTNPLSSNILASRSSCFSPTGNALFVGEGTRATTPCAPGQPSDQCPPSNAAWKYIVAHETGHMVQAHAIGSLNDVLSIPMGAPPWCKCDHVGSSNHAHCLQSVDDASTAQVEGFAQFFASRIWNDREAPDCTFVYYKELMLGDPTAPGEATPPIANTVCPMLPALTGTVPAGFKIVSPPLRVDCRPQLNPQAPKSWRNEICRTPGTTDFNLDGVEWDWMNFFYDVNTVDAPAGTRFSMLDINNSYVQACGLANPTPVSPSQPCDANPNVSPSIPSFTPSFRSLQDAVGIRFQTAPDKINRFRDSAVTYGVDEN